MKKWIIKKLVKDSDEWSYGVDTMRLNIKTEPEKGNIIKIIEKLRLVDEDNSNYSYIYLDSKKLLLSKMRTKKGYGIMGIIIYLDIPVPLFFLEEYGAGIRDITRSWGNIIYYSWYYRLLIIGGVSTPLQKFFNWVNEDLFVTRFDFRVDFFYKEKTKIFRPSLITKIRKRSKIKYHIKGENIESWSYWDRKSKRYLIRWYDKLQDSIVKNKFALYKDYFKFQSVYRLEFEFLNHFCKSKDFKNVKFQDFQYLLDKAKALMDVDKSFWPIFQGKNETDINEIKDRYKYADSTKGYIRGCYNAGINIFWLFEEVLESLGKKEEEIFKIFLDYVERKKGFWGYIEKMEDIKLMNDVYSIFWENKK